MKTLKIDEGYVIDTEASNLETGVIVLKPKEIERFEDLGVVSGCYIDASSKLLSAKELKSNIFNRNVYPDEAGALCTLALSQLLQLRKPIIKSWTPQWGHTSQPKYIIYRYGDIIEVSTVSNVYNELSFETWAHAERFMMVHKDLIKQYYKL